MLIKLPAKLLLGVLFSMISVFVFSQSAIQGRILAASSKTPLVGASVSVKGNNTAAVTGTDGSFRIQVQPGDILVISNVGYIGREVPVADAATIELADDPQNLNEVVVTALGIKKDRKKLGYAVQEVRGERLEIFTSRYRRGITNGQHL